LKLKIYLADLYHDFFGAKQFVPINIGYIGSYCMEKFGDEIDVQLFKSADHLLDSIDQQPPHIIGLSNYCWNENLNQFVASQVKEKFPHIPIVMGGPNISLGDEGIKNFLNTKSYIDAYMMFGAESIFCNLIEKMLGWDSSRLDLSEKIRTSNIAGLYALVEGELIGLPNSETGKNLDFIPSPYLNGMLDQFLDQNMIPILETNRGCPFSCTFCVWGISALNKLKTFSLDRVFSELDYISNYGLNFPHIYFADANFGILKRDVEIAEKIRQLYESTKSFSAVEMYWSKSAQPHMLDIGKALGNLSHTYVAFQSLDPVVLEGMKRTNIGLDKLKFLIEGLKEYSHSAQTDILLGAPGETVESHISSLDGVLSYGIDHIRGGEIQLLPGSELETPEVREQHSIKTKYRFFEGCAGIYKGKLIYELQEVIRETSTMTEEEMKYLRLLRSLFFGAVTIGEFLPIIYVLRHFKISFPNVLVRVLLLSSENKIFSPVLDWIRHEIDVEFFEDQEEVARFLEKDENRDQFINSGFTKLNFSVSARLINNSDELKSYYDCVEIALNKELEGTVSPQVIKELLLICRQRNYIASVLNGNQSNQISLKLSPETNLLLHNCGYLNSSEEEKNSEILLDLDSITANQIKKSIRSKGNDLSLFDLSQILQMNWGRTYLEPINH